MSRHEDGRPPGGVPPERRPGRDRAARERAGRTAELIAAAWLRLKGYRVLDRRFATAVGEIDLVAARAGLVVFVEVKRRATVEAALEALRPRQQLRIARAADLWLQRRPSARLHDCRFDVVGIIPWRLPVHLVDVWRPLPPPARGRRGRGAWS